MSQRDRILLGALATLAVLAGGWLMIVKPQRKQATDLQTQITAQQTQLSGAAAVAAQYRAARARLLKHPEVFEQSAKALPNRTAMPDLLRTITRTADGTGVKVGDLTTSGGGASPSPGISSVGLSLTFTGDFLALQRYLSRLQHFVQVSKEKVAAKGRLIAIDSVQLAPGADGGGLTATVKATAYILQPGALSSTPATTTAAPATTPAAPAATGTASTPTPSGGTQ